MTIQEQIRDTGKQPEAAKTAATGGRQFLMSVARLLSRAFSRHADLLVTLLLMWFVARYYLVLQAPFFVRSIDFYDTSWGLDMMAKAHQGIWLGKGGIFTYGPLFQWLFTWAPLRHGMSLGSFYHYFWIFQYWSIILPLYGTSALLLHRQPGWVRAFYLLLLVVFWAPVYWILFDIKLLVPLCWFAVFLRMQADPGKTFLSLCWRAMTAATLIAVAFLISGDAGVYSAIAFIIVVGTSLLYEHARPNLGQAAKYVSLTGVFFGIWILAINRAAGKFLDFHFWRATYELVTQYRWSHAVRMLPETTTILAVAVSLNLVIFAGQWLVYRRTSEVLPRARAAWLAMLSFALITLETLLVSSEKFHVSIGLFPWIALSAALLLGATESRLSALRLSVSVCIIVAITATFSGPNHLFIPANVLANRSALATAHTCPPGFYELDQVCLQIADFSELRMVRDFLALHSVESDSIGVFPYQNVYGFVARRRVAGEVLQSYLIAGDYLTQRQIESLEQAPPSWAVYSSEPLQSIAVNGIPNFTRTPSIWLYWQRWYRNDFDALPGLMVLRRDEERGGRWRMISTSVLARSAPVTENSGETALPLNTLGNDWDFIKISLRAKYPWWWRLAKPSVFAVRVHFEDGKDNLVPAIVQPDRPYEIWVFPWEQAQLANYFSSNPEQWRSGPRPRIQSVFLQCRQRDWLSVAPSQITIQDVQTVKLSEQ